MIRHLEYQGYRYNYIIWSEYEENVDKIYFPKVKNLKKKYKKYIDIGASFDIETTNIENEHKAVMYIWQFALNDLVICGRSWEEFIDFMNYISNLYNINESNRMIIWVHNLSFEFQFIKKLIPWNIGKKGYPEIFALDPRKIVKAVSGGFEFRDSLVLTNSSLKKVADDFNLKYKKLKGDLNYKIVRIGGSDPTPLTDPEYAYCFNDVLILTDFYHKYIKNEFINKNINIPLTSTGIVRDELLRHFKLLNKKERYAHKNYISKAYPTYEIYDILMRFVYRGGYVHADPALTYDVIMYSLGSFDFKSAYPAALLQELYPTEFIECDKSRYIYMLDKRTNKKEAFFGCFKFKNIRSKGKISYESSNKILEYNNAFWDNGRLWKADSITVWLTEYDLMIYDDVYIWDDIECIKLYSSVKKPLPEFVKDLILKYFYLKETIDKIKDPVEYRNAKSKLNSIYGMMVTSLYFYEYHYNEEKSIIESMPSEKTYNQLIDKQILLPQWGIWCTAIVRYRLIHYGFLKCPNDSIYGDTDSVKLKNIWENIYIFNDFNNMIKRINKKMYVGKYDRSIFKNIGIFDFEGKLLKFKTLGCKRYIYSHSEYDRKSEKYFLKTETTVAGMKKGTLQEYAYATGQDAYDIFKEGLILDLSFSNKLTSIYTDEEFNYSLTDSRGITLSGVEKSCVALIEIPFQLNMTEDFLLFISEIKKLNQNRLIKRNYGGLFL